MKCNRCWKGIPKVNELPKGWQSKPIAEVLSVYDNGIWGPEAKRSGILILRSTNFRNDGTISFENVACRVVERRKAEKRRLAPGDILLERSGGGPKQPVGRVVFFNRSEGEYYFGNFVTRLRANRSVIDPSFLFHVLWFLHIEGKTITLQKQTTGIRNLNFKEYLKLTIPFPPLEEQRRIVGRIEELTRPIEEAKRLRQAAREQAEKIMPAALAEVFGRAESEGWENLRVSEIAVEIKSGFACAKKHAVDSGIPHLRTNNIGVNGELDMAQLTCFPPHLVDLETYDLQAGDVLFNNTNSTELVGKTAIVREDHPYAFSNHITRLRVNRQLVQPEWLAICLRVLWHSGFFARNCRRWIGQSGFSATMLRDVEIPLPPLEEQQRILAHLEGCQARIRQLSRLQEETQAHLDALIPAVLGKAFRGGL